MSDRKKILRQFKPGDRVAYAVEGDNGRETIWATVVGVDPSGGALNVHDDHAPDGLRHYVTPGELTRWPSRIDGMARYRADFCAEADVDGLADQVEHAAQILRREGTSSDPADREMAYDEALRILAAARRGVSQARAALWSREGT